MDYMQRLKNLREDHDYTQEYVAQVLGTSQTMYARYEREANELPIRHLVTLCKLYNISADWLLDIKWWLWVDNTIQSFSISYYFQKNSVVFFPKHRWFTLSIKETKVLLLPFAVSSLIISDLSLIETFCWLITLTRYLFCKKASPNVPQNNPNGNQMALFNSKYIP